MALQGIDVSKWQGTIDWKKVKNSGKKFALLKVTQKNNSVEEKFEDNYKGCTENGIPVGVYRYVYAQNTGEAKKEANAIVSVLKGKEISCGVWIDMEDSSISGLGKDKLKNIIDAEATILKNAGYKVGIYCNKNWYDNILDGKGLSKTYPFWIARYPSNDTGTYNADSSLSPKNYAVAWQYSSKGKVDGISGNVDLDVAFEDLTALMKGNSESTSQGTSSGNSSKPSTSTPTKKDTITVDGLWGVDTTKKAQKVFGTTVDGKVSNQYNDYKKSNPELLSSSWEWESNPGKNGSQLIKAIQKKVNSITKAGLTVDGFIGPKTIKGIQKFLNKVANAKLSVDGLMGPKSIKAFQTWLNKQ